MFQYIKKQEDDDVNYNNYRKKNSFVKMKDFKNNNVK